MVARSEAHDSGLCAADNPTRRRFATDLLNFTLAGPNVNRYQKVDKDAAEWLPDQNRCWFAARVIAVRQKYELTIDQREADALDRVLAACSSTALVTVPPGVRRPRQHRQAARTRASPNWTSTETVASVVPRRGQHEIAPVGVVTRRIRSCATAMGTAWSVSPDRRFSARASPDAPPRAPRARGPYRNCTELRRDHPNGVPRGHPAYQPRMDRDNDGRACER